ncbi:hypothetical protein A2397_04660 [Candidatus Amesbacteria bacterium RIFOXYB1_FULL_44_23]|uniref:AB hydrolase-1 domain-containing protein n=1 Tax=Candidatus Amesbacteria bacterium RIFOXYB1_FULL_44_23 TaxID=1797263 RepID=A0A1F4ZTA2_9BACT|nr:MAG: hypothetical protein A2397_04660 [Candidatus Amesbacteria bacterium RIFOXYB1_FULL_44_23]
MKKEHFVIVVPGLGDGERSMKLLTGHWRKHGLEPVVQLMEWRNGEDFMPKLGRLTRLIDELAERGKVSLVGTSAGGSAAINAFGERKDKIHRVVNVCGRLRVGTHVGIHGFEARTTSSPAFAQSVRLLEKRENEFNKKDREKIMTIHALFGDELVPKNTTTIEGANNITVPMFEHVLSITAALTVFSGPLIRFLLEP